MPNVKFKIAMDNRIRPGQDTRNQILAALQAQGIDVQAATPVYDPVTGKLIETYVSLPDTASAQAQAAIDANPGVAVATPPIPEPLYIYDLTDITLTGVTGMKDGAAAVGPDWMIVNHADLELMQERPAGHVVGAAATYGDGTSSALPGSLLYVQNYPQASDADIVIPDTGIELAYDGNTLDLTHTQITVGQSSAGVYFPAVHAFWIDIAGKLYHCRRNNDPNLPDISLRTFEEAIAFGPV